MTIHQRMLEWERQDIERSLDAYKWELAKTNNENRSGLMLRMSQTLMRQARVTAAIAGSPEQQREGWIASSIERLDALDQKIRTRTKREKAA